MTAIGEKLGVNLPPCGGSSDEDVAPQATHIGSRGGFPSGREPSPMMDFGGSPGTASLAPAAVATDILDDQDATEVIGSDDSGRSVTIRIHSTSSTEEIQSD